MILLMYDIPPHAEVDFTPYPSIREHSALTEHEAHHQHSE